MVKSTYATRARGSRENLVAADATFKSTRRSQSLLQEPYDEGFEECCGCLLGCLVTCLRFVGMCLYVIICGWFQI